MPFNATIAWRQSPFLRQFILITTNIYCCRNSKSNNVSWTDGVVVWEMGFLIKASKCKKYANSWSLLAISYFTFKKLFIRFTFCGVRQMLYFPCLKYFHAIFFWGEMVCGPLSASLTWISFRERSSSHKATNLLILK